MRCEIRIPTFRRPRLLERALASVVAQTHQDWRCIVFDDCPDASARQIVERKGDERIRYLHNAHALGAIGNIDQAFRNQPFDGGKWAMVLEDDNYLLPNHIAVQLDTCRSHGVPVAMSAQLVEEVIEPGVPGRICDNRTLAWIYPEGRYPYRALRAAVLFSHAFSNGAAFWQIGCASDFEIGGSTTRPGVQETLRILRLKGDVHVSHHATAVWRANDPRESYVSQGPAQGFFRRIGMRWGQMQELREIIDYRRWYLARHGFAGAVEFVERIGPVHRQKIERAVLLSGHYIALTDRGLFWRLAQMAKGYAFRTVIGSRLRLEKFDNADVPTIAAES